MIRLTTRSGIEGGSKGEVVGADIAHVGMAA